MTSHGNAVEVAASNGDYRNGLAWLLPAVVLIGSLILGLVLWQTNSAAEPIDLGLSTFRVAGCAACHGRNGEGGVGPAMAGHEAEQVIRQVRAPFGAMPLFTLTELNDDKLAAIVDFVTGLEPVDLGDAHGHGDTSALNPRDILIGRHWMAQRSMLEGDVAEAVHHISHLDELVSGEHQVAMNEVVALLEAGDFETAQSRMTEMLAGFVPQSGFIEQLHVQLAVEALAAGDIAEAKENLERVGDGPLADVAHEALTAVDAGQTQEAIELLMAALGGADHDDDGAEPHDDEMVGMDDDNAELHDDAMVGMDDDHEEPLVDAEVHEDAEPHDG